MFFLLHHPDACPIPIPNSAILFCRNFNPSCTLELAGEALKIYLARCWWLMPVILATQEAEIRRIVV
jgi:hypothetical protein